ncbi:DUF5333 domain-containing protein [Tabrizicola oligotrophica]|uniref:DUF5333 domain-containing protein n=1 Tax=Tabrizicola oligotrophica TaxID=2710650 RepID=A0A6M0QN18_9RHOB|nr:DUF5333 domain-containing protein [Tabrizicola oligotrophica]NEY88858.1 DUF5333 domain-containing protein [Tabrizicola oligotrophica]
MKTTLPLAFALIAAPALALEPITAEKHINETLLMGFIADAIDDNCDTISARKLRALGELMSLRDYALDKGYSRDEVSAFVEDKAEKTRRKAAAADWLAARGAVPGQGAAFCTVGAEEIAKDTLIGQLLRSDE